jgi:hypothetical protein
MAKAGPATVTAAPKSESAAVERNVLRDCSIGSACKEEEVFCIEAGAKALAAAMIEKTERMASFIVLGALRKTNKGSKKHG